MKKLFVLSILTALMLPSCDEEGCDTTIAPQVSESVFAAILILDQNGNEVFDYPVKIGFQKRWCDGDWEIIVSYSGQTTYNGKYYTTSPQYTLNNEEDYVLVMYEAGEGATKQEYSERATYADFSGLLVKQHTFEIVQ